MDFGLVMSYLYLEESGDLGDPTKKTGASRHFVIVVMAVDGLKDNKVLEKAARRTLSSKVWGKGWHRSHHVVELKATHTTLAIKKYFYHRVADVPFQLYTTVLDKARYSNFSSEKKSRVYDFITRLTLKGLPLEQAETKVTFTIDKSKNKPEIQDFNEYILREFETRVPPHVPRVINHNYSHENKLLQAVDFFAWGIFKKYKVGDVEWYDFFQKKIAYERVYPK